MHSRVAQLYVLLLGQPLLNRLVAGKALRLGQTFFERLHRLWRNRLLPRLRSRLADVLKTLQTAVFVEGEPIGYRVAMNAEMTSSSAPAFGLAALQQQQHVKATLNLRVALLAHETFKLIG